MRKGLDCNRDLRSPEALEWLTGIARHIGSTDPVMIGAAAILEACGYERTHEQLMLPGETDMPRVMVA